MGGYSTVQAGSVRSIHGFKISDANGSVGDTPRYAIKVLLQQPFDMPPSTR